MSSWTINPEAINFVETYLRNDLKYPLDLGENLGLKKLKINSDSELGRHIAFEYKYNLDTYPDIYLFKSTLKKDVMQLKGTILGTIQSLMSSKDFPGCKSVTKEYVGIVAFLLFHTTFVDANNRTTNLLDFINGKNTNAATKDLLNKPDIKAYYEAIFEAVYVASLRTGDFLEKIKDLYLFKYEPYNEIAIVNNNGNVNSKKPQANPKPKPKPKAIKISITDTTLIKDILYPTIRTKNGFKFTKANYSKSTIIQEFLKKKFKYILEDETFLKSSNQNIQEMDKYNYLLNNCNPNRCTSVREDDDVMGTPFVEYNMGQINEIYNIDYSYCFSIPYLTAALLGTRGRLAPVLKGALRYTTLKHYDDLSMYMANYYMLNQDKIQEDIDSMLGSFTESEKGILKLFKFSDGKQVFEGKYTLSDKINIKNTNVNVKANYLLLRDFFNFMLYDFDKQAALLGLADMYVKTNGLILDIIGYVGYICLSDNVTGGADVSDFLSAGPVLQKFLEFINVNKDTFTGLENFKSNGDSLGQIIKDIPSTCIHGIGLRMLAFYLGCFTMLGDLFKSKQNNNEFMKDLIYKPTDDYELSKDELDELSKELLKESPFFKIIQNKAGEVRYYTAVHDEFDAKLVPNAKAYHIMEFKHDGTCGQWIGRMDYYDSYVKLDNSLLTIDENVMLLPINTKGYFYADPKNKHIDITKHYKNILDVLNIAENLQDQRVNRFIKLIDHCQDVMRLIPTKNTKNTKNVKTDDIIEPLLYKDIALIKLGNNKDDEWKARPIDMIAKLNYSTSTNTGASANASGNANATVQIKNAYTNINILEQALPYKLIDNILHPSPMKYNIETDIKPITNCIEGIKNIDNSIENAFRTFHNSSSAANFDIFIGISFEMNVFQPDNTNKITNKITFGDIGSHDIVALKMNLMKNKEMDDANKQAYLLVLDIMQNLTINNFIKYLAKLSETQSNENLTPLVPVALNKLKTDIINRTIVLTALTYRFNQNNYTVEYNLPSTDDDIVIVKDFYTKFSLGWIRRINLEFSKDIVPTQHLHLDNLESEYIAMKPLIIKAMQNNIRAANNTIDGNNAKLANYLNDKLKSVYSEIKAVKKHFSHYDLTQNAQELIPTKLRLLQKAIVAEKTGIRLLEYQMYKEAINEIFKNNKNEFDIPNMTTRKIIEKLFKILEDNYL